MQISDSMMSMGQRESLPSATDQSADGHLGDGDARERRRDALEQYCSTGGANHARYVLMAAKLIAPVLEQRFEDGFDWVLEHLRSTKVGTSMVPHENPNLACSNI